MKKKNQFKKPNPIIYFIYRLICKFIAKFIFNTKVLRNETKGVKGPYIILANHESQIDFINLSVAMRRRIHMVISNSFYQTLSIKPLLDMIQVIPKQQFQTAPSDIKKMKKVIENEMPLAIYPVGLMTENGMSTDPGASIGKLLKFLKTDVYVCFSEGSYLTNPKWSKQRRKGQITVDVYKLLSKEEIANYTDAELHQLVRKHIDYNAYENQRKNMIAYKHGDNIEGLEYVLYQCPKCKSVKSIISHNLSNLKCNCCNYEVKADKYGFLTGSDIIYDSPADWSAEILNNLKEEIENNPQYALTDEVTISMINYKKRRFEEVGSGKVSINKDNITLTGMIKNEEISHSFVTKTYPMLPFVPGKQLELQDGQTIYRLKFKDPYNVMIFINIIKVVSLLN